METQENFVRFAISSCYDFLDTPIDTKSTKFLHHPEVPAYLGQKEPFKNTQDLQNFVKLICSQEACQYKPPSLNYDYHGGMCPDSMNGPAKPPPSSGFRRDGRGKLRLRTVKARRGTMTRRGSRTFQRPRRRS